MVVSDIAIGGDSGLLGEVPVEPFAGLSAQSAFGDVLPTAMLRAWISSTWEWARSTIFETSRIARSVIVKAESTFEEIIQLPVRF